MTQPLQEFRTTIEACGAKIYKFIANHAYLVKMAPDAREAVAALPFVRWVGPYHPAYRLEDFLRNNRARADELFPSQRYYTCQTFVGVGEPAVKFTMTYADPAGVPGAAHARINDLTLRVVSPSGVEYWGNNGLATDNWSQPGGAPDTINTVENVFVRNPESGTWTAMVIASEINEDGHVETPELDADFALVITGTPGFALNIRLVNPAPEYLTPGEPTPIVVAIDNGLEMYVPGSGTLHYSYDGGAQVGARDDSPGGFHSADQPGPSAFQRPRRAEQLGR